MNFKQSKTRILELDLKGCVYLNHFSQCKEVATFFRQISRLGDGVFWCALLGIVWLLKGLGYTPQIVYLLLGGAVATSIYKILKAKTTRPRPYQVHQVIILGERPLDHFSFPSGHTLHAVMASVSLGYIQPALLIIMLPFTILVAISRVVLGLHYPSDVLVGALLGLFLGAALIGLAISLGIQF